MSNNFIKIWFSYACQQLPDIAESCLFFSDESQESFSLIEATSEEFSQSKAVHESLQAAVSRRKAIVIQQPAKRQVSSSAAVVADINSKNLKDMKGLNIVSCFDGMSCLQIALEKLAIPVNKYFASEIDKYAMKVTPGGFVMKTYDILSYYN